MASKYFIKIDGIEEIEINQGTYNNIKVFLENFKYKFACNQRFVYNEESYANCCEKGDIPTPDSKYRIEFEYDVFLIILNSMTANFRI